MALLADRIFTYPSLPQLQARQRRPAKKFESHCRLRVYERQGQPHGRVALVTPCEDSTGTPPRDAAPYLAPLICAAYNIHPQRLTLVLEDDGARTWLVLEPAAPHVFHVREERALPEFAWRELVGDDSGEPAP